MNRYGIFLKKEAGYERRNDEIIRVLEADGWKADRNRDKDYIVVRTGRNYHLYRDELEIKRYLLTQLKKDEVFRIVLVKE